MSLFKYKARRPSGEVVVETVESDSAVAVAKRLG